MGNTASTLIEAAPVGLIVFDLDGEIRFANQAAHELFGRAAERLTGQSIAALLPEALETNGSGAPHGEVSRHLSGRLRAGGQVPVEFRLATIESQNERLRVAAVSDIGDALKLRRSLADRERDLRRSNDELQQFADVAAHDLREPLRTVASFTDALLERLGDGLEPVSRDYVGFIRDGVERMEQMIGDLLSYARLDDPTRMMGPVDTGVLARDVVDSLKVAIEEGGASLRIGNLPTVIGDRSQLGQLLQNLIDNAVKFRHPDRSPTIRIEAERHRTAWLFRVIDNGIGIRPDHAERAFLMFQRLNDRSRFAGRGIGLAVAKKIAERHGGRLWLESGVGEGTTFYFTIPDPEHRPQPGSEQESDE